MSSETIPAVTTVRHVLVNINRKKHGRTCPYCGSGNTYLISGNAFMIKEEATRGLEMDKVKVVEGKAAFCK